MRKMNVTFFYDNEIYEETDERAYICFSIYAGNPLEALKKAFGEIPDTVNLGEIESVTVMDNGESFSFSSDWFLHSLMDEVYGLQKQISTEEK